MLQVIRGDDIIAMIQSPHELIDTLQSATGRLFVIEEVAPAGEFLPSGYTCQRWGTAARQANGVVTIDREAWDAW